MAPNALSQICPKLSNNKWQLRCWVPSFQINTYARVFPCAKVTSISPRNSLSILCSHPHSPFPLDLWSTSSCVSSGGLAGLNMTSWYSLAIITSRRNYLLGALVLAGCFFVFQFYSESSYAFKNGPSLKSDSAKSLLDMPPLLEHGVDARIEWNSDPVPETRLIRHAPGGYGPMGLITLSEIDAIRVDYFRLLIHLEWDVLRRDRYARRLPWNQNDDFFRVSRWKWTGRGSKTWAYRSGYANCLYKTSETRVWTVCKSAWWSNGQYHPIRLITCILIICQ